MGAKLEPPTLDVDSSTEWPWGPCKMWWYVERYINMLI